MWETGQSRGSCRLGEGRPLCGSATLPTGHSGDEALLTPQSMDR